MKYKILSITRSADDWKAYERDVVDLCDDSPFGLDKDNEEVNFTPVIVWALVEDEKGERSVCAVVPGVPYGTRLVPPHSHTDNCFMCVT